MSIELSGKQTRDADLAVSVCRPAPSLTKQGQIHDFAINLTVGNRASITQLKLLKKELHILPLISVSGIVNYVFVN
jgi:hypothetical protein